MDNFTKTVQYSGETKVDGIVVSYNFSVRNSEASSVQFSFSVGKATVTGSYDPNTDYVYYNVTGSVLQNEGIVALVIEKAKTLIVELTNEL